MPIAEFPIGPLGTNCLVVYNATDALVVDPGGDVTTGLDEVIDFLNANHLTLRAILLTHLHFDHIYGVADLLEKYGADIPVLGNPADFPMLENSLGRGEMFGFPRVKPFTPAELPAGPFTLGTISGVVLPTPGHTPGGLSIHLPAETAVLAGDTLFARSVGRTDLPGGDFPTLRDSITQKLFALPDETTVYCGHGPQTSIGGEKKNNPYV